MTFWNEYSEKQIGSVIGHRMAHEVAPIDGKKKREWESGGNANGMFWTISSLHFLRNHFLIFPPSGRTTKGRNRTGCPKSWNRVQEEDKNRETERKRENILDKGTRISQMKERKEEETIINYSTDICSFSHFFSVKTDTRKDWNSRKKQGEWEKSLQFNRLKE